MSEVVAVLCADLHLSEKPPTARSAEEDWFAAQARPLEELRGLVVKHDCPAIVAGDVFDRWNPSPSVINFAIEHLPDRIYKTYAVPGQHDLRFHRYDDLGSTAYWTLVEAGVIENIEPGKPVWAGPLLLHGFPFGFDVTPPEGKDRRITVAVAHSYISTGRCSYPGALEESRVGAWRKRLRGYDAAVFGDNHKGFCARAGGCCVFNCGALIRRSADEWGYTPAVGLLDEDGRVEPHFLDVSKDKWVDAQLLEGTQSGAGPGLADFVGELGSLSASSLDFREALKRYLRDEEPDASVCDVLLEVLEG